MKKSCRVGGLVAGTQGGKRVGCSRFPRRAGGHISRRVKQCKRWQKRGKHIRGMHPGAPPINYVIVKYWPPLPSELHPAVADLSPIPCASRPQVPTRTSPQGKCRGDKAGHHPVPAGRKVRGSDEEASEGSERPMRAVNEGHMIGRHVGGGDGPDEPRGAADGRLGLGSWRGVRLI